MFSSDTEDVSFTYLNFKVSLILFARRILVFGLEDLVSLKYEEKEMRKLNYMNSHYQRILYILRLIHHVNSSGPIND